MREYDFEYFRGRGAVLSHDDILSDEDILSDKDILCGLDVAILPNVVQLIESTRSFPNAC